MSILLYRRRLSLESGVGQLLRMQAHGLAAEGQAVRVAGHKGCLKFFLKTGLRARRLSLRNARRMAAERKCFVVDHQLGVPEADLVFVHNLLSEARRHLPREELEAGAAEEREFFRACRRDTVIVANSGLVKRALIEHFALPAARIAVCEPGFQSARFNAAAAAALRARARRHLVVPDNSNLIGFITSGDLHKRGLDIFLDTAGRILEAEPRSRFLVVGSKRLPPWAREHPSVAAGRVLYRPKGGRPELWFSALDLFLYPARWEEFGMVVSEAQAMGVPIVTSRLVGAAECLPGEYGEWLVDRPDAAALAERTLALLADTATRRALIAAGLESSKAYDDRRYARVSARLILDQKRRLK